ncbi:DoxX family protein [Paenibacillus solisilvae]|uniref:DoxX family protein n=1 Tax=Paenibacillus solisilvae TaxID=2486751 RepID=A0ABW0VWX8_9BACL
MNIIFVILQSFLLVSMAFGGGSKLAGAKNFVEMFESIKLPQWFRVVTGLVQLAGAAGLVIGYWNPAAAVWAGIWIGITMLVACLSHFRYYSKNVGEPTMQGSFSFPKRRRQHFAKAGFCTYVYIPMT